MPGNRSLDEFIGGGGGEGERRKTDSEPDPPGAEGPSVEPADDAEHHEGAERQEPEPIATTRAWSPGGAACEACGAVVEERWRSADGLVCGACKEW